jgi:hypothetical protein
MPKKTAAFMAKNIWVRSMERVPLPAQGAGISGCSWSTSSPRWAASWRMHHWQIFLPQTNPGSLRPH